MATIRRSNAPKRMNNNSNPKYESNNHKTAQEMRNPHSNSGPLPRLYVDTITAAFGEGADLHADVLKISPDAVAIEQRIAYFKRGREIMKEAGSAISAPRDLPPPIRARLKAVNMAYEIISNPEWQREYETRNDAPRIKAGVRFNDNIQEHFFQREPWEEEYMRQKRERRMQRLKELGESDALSLDAFWADIMKDLDSFELGLDGFLQAFPDQMSGAEPKESPDDSSFPDQSFSSWMSNSVKKEEEPEPDIDIETSSYMSSFNPFADETPSKRTSRNNVRSPTSLPQELGEASRVAEKKESHHDNIFPDDIPGYDQNDVTNPLDVSPVTNPTFDGGEVSDDDATNPYEDGALDVTPDDISNPFSAAASDSRFSIGTFQKMQKQQKARRSARPSTSRKEPSKNPFDEDANNDDDQNSVFDGLEDVWEDEGVHVDGVSVISDLSESVVAKRAKQRQQPFDPFDAKGDTRGSSSNNNKISSVGNPSWGGTENEQVGFTAAASAIAACCANIVADCQKNTHALANMELKNFTGLNKTALPSLFEAEEKKRHEEEEEDDPFDEMEQLFSEMGDELNNELGEF